MSPVERSTTRDLPGGGLARSEDPEWAWAPYEPTQDRPWDRARVAHLYRRAAFGATWSEMSRAIEEGPRRSVARLLRGSDGAADYQLRMDEYEIRGGSGSVESLKAWWLRRMLETPHPLLEMMTLFWHDWFATSQVDVKDAGLMGRHVRLLREHALGDPGALLRQVSRDPALLLGLGARASRRMLPDERFPRALLEHFTLGSGNFAEADVQAAARAFTGRFVLRGRLRYFAREHDSGTKRFLGEKGEFRGEDVLEILLRRPETYRTLARHLYRQFICDLDEPVDGLVDALAALLRGKPTLAGMLEVLLCSNLFYSPRAYRRRLRSPVEYALGIIRSLEARVPTVSLGKDLAALGQDLYSPPTVAGWKGGQKWFDWWTVVGRSNLALDLLSEDGPYGGSVDPLGLAARYGREGPEEVGCLLVDLLLGDGASDAVRAGLLQACRPEEFSGNGGASAGARRLCHLIVTLPEFQVT